MKVFLSLKWLSIMLLMCTVNGAVLDPALFLSPSPPLTDTSDSIPSGELWSHPSDTSNGVERSSRGTSELTLVRGKQPTILENQESMETAETFWPFIRNTAVEVKGLQIPLTFSMSGMYGGYGTGTGSMYGNTYASVSNAGASFLSNVKTLAGSGYGTYGSGFPATRIYGSGGAPTWSGWGNGKWGHYGKG